MFEDLTYEEMVETDGGVIPFLLLAAGGAEFLEGLAIGTGVTAGFIAVTRH